MNLLFGLFASSKQPPHARPAAPAPRSGGDTQTQLDTTRRQLVAMAVSDTLRMHGIPAEWLDMTALPVSGRQRGMQVTLVLKEWQPSLLGYAMTLQNHIRSRLLRLDPLAGQWMRGMTWKFEAAGESCCPPMPPAGHWCGTVPEKAAPREAQPSRSALDRLLANGDRAFGQGGRQAPDFAPTQPIAIS